MALLLCSAQPVHSETEPASAPDQPAPSLRRADKPGVYLRLGVGLDEPERSRYRDDSCSSIDPPALFGCVRTTDGRPLGARGSFDSTVVVDAALGYRFLPWLRAEGLLSWRPSMDFSGQSNFIGAGDLQPVTGSVSSLAGFGVAYVDLPPIGLVQPFLGAGVGAAHNQMGAMRYSFPALSANATTTTPDGSRTNLAKPAKLPLFEQEHMLAGIQYNLRPVFELSPTSRHRADRCAFAPRLRCGFLQQQARLRSCR
jgi:opacity protein-like surface antigen